MGNFLGSISAGSAEAMPLYDSKSSLPEDKARGHNCSRNDTGSGDVLLPLGQGHAPGARSFLIKKPDLRIPSLYPSGRGRGGGSLLEHAPEPTQLSLRLAHRLRIDVERLHRLDEQSHEPVEVNLGDTSLLEQPLVRLGQVRGDVHRVPRPFRRSERRRDDVEGVTLQFVHVRVQEELRQDRVDYDTRVKLVHEPYQLLGTAELVHQIEMSFGVFVLLVATLGRTAGVGDPRCLRCCDGVIVTICGRLVGRYHFRGD
mmetsp:Transcript_3532/g.6154  ORF Transcript_3532/g.6154 Transcript_3532/m.6154 type:complete len:257 (+) Transcript_3532:285-1055(+)